MTRRPIAPARIAAYEVLRAVGSGAADLPHALAQARGGLTDDRDRALAAEIATGALRWQGAFDHVIAAFTKRSIDRLDPEVVAILRGAIFQLLHLDRVPASAAVNDAVSLARRAGKSSAAPLVNAVLRRVSRERARLPLPPPPPRGPAVDYLAISLSHPRWLAERWLDAYGFAAAEAWMTFNNTPAPLTLRVNRLKTTTSALIDSLAAHGVTVQRGRHSPDALLVTGGNPLLTPIADDGLFFVQDEASQLVASIVDANAGDRVLDACASPGGKTVAIAGTMNDGGLVVAADVRGRRIDLLTRTVARSGAASIKIVQADAATLPFSSPGAAVSFDWILLDAPCSGLGTIRRDPDIRWRRQPADLLRFRESQVAMLREAARVLKPGGHLVYSTCSSEPEENEDVVAAVIADGTLRRASPDRFPAHVTSLLGASGDFRSYPFRDGLEAFFAALLVRPLPSR